MSRSSARRMVNGFATLWLTLLPTVALACPACAGRDDGTSLRTFVVLGSMILLPFVVAGVVVEIIRRIESDSSR